MNIESIMPLIAGILALAISLVLARMYAQRRRMQHLLWAIGMLLWAISDFTQLYALLVAWTVAIYLTYFFGSIMLAGFLGAGTIYLVFPKSKWSRHYLWFNIIFGVALVISLLVFPINVSALQQVVTGADPISSAVTNTIAAIVNIPALFTFAGGALYSFIKWRKAYALLILLGAVIPAIGGTLAAIYIPQFLPFTDFFGILFLGFGFYLSFNAKPLK